MQPLPGQTNPIVLPRRMVSRGLSSSRKLLSSLQATAGGGEQQHALRGLALAHTRARMRTMPCTTAALVQVAGITLAIVGGLHSRELWLPRRPLPAQVLRPHCPLPRRGAPWSCRWAPLSQWRAAPQVCASLCACVRAHTAPRLHVQACKSCWQCEDRAVRGLTSAQ